MTKSSHLSTPAQARTSEDNPSQASVIIDGVYKYFDSGGPAALKDVSAKLYPGKITGLVGPDGAGKTTLIRMITGLLTPAQGSIHVNGFNAMTEQAHVHDITGYMPQRFGLYEELSVEENLNLYADLFRLGQEYRERQFETLLRLTQMLPFRERLAGKLSGGMKQKLGLSCALLRQPRVLLLDEPSVGVDPISRRELWDIVRQMVDGGTTVLWSTAYLDEAEQCDQVLALNAGEIIFSGTPEALYKPLNGRVFVTKDIDRHKRALLQEILKDTQVQDGTIRGQQVRVLMGEAAPPPDQISAGGHAYTLGWRTTSATFEDGFIALLGGIQERESQLAALIDHRDFGHTGPPISAHDLSKHFGDFVAAQDISFNVQPGEILGLLGPNGAGKSTTFKMLCSLLEPTHGASFLLGKNLKETPARFRRNLGYMAQKFSLYSNLTVQQNLDFFAGTYGLAGKQARHAKSEMVNTFALKPYLQTPAEGLPLGFKQRLALACSLMHRPPILFLDEPTSGVDPITRREFWLHINAMVQRGVTVLVTTHFMDEAEYCDQIVLIYKGQMIASGTPDQLKQEAATSAVPEPDFEQTFIHKIKEFDHAQDAHTDS